MRSEKQRVLVAFVRRPLFAVCNDLEVGRDAQVILLNLRNIRRSRRTYQEGREAPRQSGLAYAFGAGKQQRLRDAPARGHFHESCDYSGVAEKIVQDSKIPL